MVRDYRDLLEIEQHSLPNAEVGSTYALIERAARAFAQEPAMSFFLRTEDHAAPATWSYSALLSDITRAANLFRRLGVQRNDVVALVMPNLPEMHIALWGAQTAGIAFAVNPLLEGGQMAELLRKAKVRWLVTVDPDLDGQIWDRVGRAIADLPELRGVLAIDSRRYRADLEPSWVLPSELSGVRILDFCTELAAESGQCLAFAPPSADDTAAYFCTGGTTGLPKIACHSHRNEVVFCGQLASVIGEQVLHPGRTVLCALPLYHVNALIGTGLAVFAKGGHVLLATPGGYRTPGLIQRFWEIVETHRVASYSGVPTVYAGLLQVPCGDHDLSSLTAAICGAAPMPADLLERFERQTGQRVLEGYGLTEGTCASSITPASGETRVGSIGLRLPWQDMRPMILDEKGEWLRDAQTDEVGIICISGPNVFSGYLDPLHNEGIWLETPPCADRPAQRWLNTGDLGRCDQDGYFWLTGRQKELIIRGGHNIDPKSIEEVLAAHPAVAMCAAIGRPDAHAGEVPVAYVQLHPDCLVAPCELIDYAARHIAERAAVPKALILIDALPLTGVGKIFKPALIMREIERVVRYEAAEVGCALIEVRVEQSAKRGLLATYRAEGEVTRLAAALQRYSFASVAQ
jgi:fatty-acyl-CoA synthase/long-chain acyl-CoA synthetase